MLALAERIRLQDLEEVIIVDVIASGQGQLLNVWTALEDGLAISTSDLSAVNPDEFQLWELQEVLH